MMGNSNLQSTSSSLPPIPVPLNPGAGARAGHGSLSLQSMCKAGKWILYTSREHAQIRDREKGRGQMARLCCVLYHLLIIDMISIFILFSSLIDSHCKESDL